MAASNPLNRRWEEVCSGGGMGDDVPVTLFWSKSLARSVAIPGVS